MAMFKFKNSQSSVVRTSHPLDRKPGRNSGQIGFQVTKSSGCNSIGGGQGSPGGGSSAGGNNFGGGGSSSGTNRFNSVTDRLEDPSVVDEWLSRDVRQLNKMFRYFYLRDAVAGPTVDLISSLPWSGYKLMGVENKEAMSVYQESMNNFDVEMTMPQISKEFLVVGRNCISCIYSRESGLFQYFIPQDPDWLEITPIPVKGFEPKIDVISDQTIRGFLQSKDERDKRAMARLPEELIRKLQKSGKIPLEPLNTIFSCRSTFPTDWVGTSLYTRILPFWAIEKALLNSTVVAARRRTRAITHVQAGIDDKWEPEDYELDEIAMLFMQADEDPNGAIVVTRNGIDVSDVKDPGGMWKLSDEYDFLTRGKMLALGVTEEILSGTSSLKSKEVALSFFMEQIKTFRRNITNSVFNYKMFPVLAKAHGFIKKTKAEIDHKLNIRGKDREQWDIPTIVWDKDFSPKGDEEYLSLLRDLRDAGLPIGLSMFASAGDMDMDTLMGNLDKDMEYQKKLAEHKNKLKDIGIGEKDEGDLGFSSFLDKQQIWDKRGNCLGLNKKSIRSLLRNFVNTSNLSQVLSDGQAINKRLSDSLDGNTRHIAVARYALTRWGLFDKNVVSSQEHLNEIGQHIVAIHTDTEGTVDMKAVNSEFTALNSYATKEEKLTKAKADKLAKFAATAGNRDGVGDKLELWSGVGRGPVNI